MGTRGQIHIFETNVYLYQHWDSYDLPNIVKRAISKKERWCDTEYLTRIIFSEMIKDSINETIGYGIGNQIHGDIEYLITIFTGGKTQYIKVQKNISEFDNNIESWLTLFDGTFEEFLKDKQEEW